MSDPVFDQQVARLFADAPTFPDQAAFTAAVRSRLERGWIVRRLVIGLAGGIGGLIAAAQVVGADLVQRVAAASQSADAHAHDLIAELVARGQSILHAHAPPAGGEALWMVAGLATVGVALLAARLMEAL